MRLQPADDSAPAAADDRWGNAQWLPLQAGRVATAETLPRAVLTLRFPDGRVDAGRAARRAYFSRR